MGKYDPLRDHLASRAGAEHQLTMTFAQIEELVGTLPPSARTHRAWWADSSDARVEARAWRSAGWRVQSVDQSAERVIFARGRSLSDALSEPVPQSDSLTEPSHSFSPSPGQAALSSSESVPEYDVPEKGKRYREFVGDLAVAIVASATAGITGIIGLTHLPWVVLFLLSMAAGAVAFAATQAITSRKSADIAWRWWAISTSVLFVASTGAYAYHKLWDPAAGPTPVYQFVVDGNQINYIPLYGEAGGPEQSLATGSAGQNGLIGGQAYDFDCWSTARNGTEWLRYERFGQTWWAPKTLLHAPYGERQPSIPHC